MRNPDPRVAKAPRKIEALDKTKANQRAWRLISQPIQIRECIRCSAFWSLYQYPIRELAALGGLFKTAKTKQMGTFKRCNATRNYLLPPLKPITPFPSLLRISRRKPTPRVHPPPWDQEGGSTKQRRGEEGTNPAGDSSIEAGLFFKVFCGSLGSLRGESRAPPPWGRRKLKTKTRGLLQPRLWRQRCPQRGRAWGAGAAPQLEGGRTASGMKLGLWGRGGRRWQGGEGSDAGPGAPLRRRVPDLWRQVRRPPPRPVLTGPWRRGLVEAHLRHGEWACRGSRGFFVRGWDLAGGVGVPTPQPRERLRSCPQPGDGHWRRKNVGERSRESGRLKTILWLHTPPPHFVTGACWGGASWIDSSGAQHSWGSWASVDGGVLSGHGVGRNSVPRLTGHATLLLSRITVLPLGWIWSRLCRSRWGRLGGWTPAKGVSRAGLPGRGGAQESPPSASLFSRETFSPLPPTVQSAHPKTHCCSCPRCFVRGEAPPPRLQVGRLSGHRRSGTVSCLWNCPEAGAGRSDPALARGPDRGPSSCHTSLEVGENCAGVLEDVTDPLTRCSPACAGAPLAGGIGTSSFLPTPPFPPTPRIPSNCVVSLLQMKDLGAEYLAGREGVQLFGLLNIYLEQEQRFQPREKGLSLIEATPEVSSQKRDLG